MNSTITPRTYRAIYRLLNRVSPVDFDCGMLCDSICCTCTYEPEDVEYTAEGDVNADSYMGLYLLPGEEKVHPFKDGEPARSDWLDWGHILAEDYEFPESWSGKVWFLQCKNPPHCNRALRPIQCRTFPLSPHIDESDKLHLILNCDELPYECPLIFEDYPLNDNFIRATYTVWKHLIRDASIRDLIREDSKFREECDADIKIIL